jgi:hypothetical protein
MVSDIIGYLSQGIGKYNHNDEKIGKLLSAEHFYPLLSNSAS